MLNRGFYVKKGRINDNISPYMVKIYPYKCSIGWEIMNF